MTDTTSISSAATPGVTLKPLIEFLVTERKVEKNIDHSQLDLPSLRVSTNIKTTTTTPIHTGESSTTGRGLSTVKQGKKSGVVFLGYDDDKLILEHQNRMQMQESAEAKSEKSKKTSKSGKTEEIKQDGNDPSERRRHRKRKFEKKWFHQSHPNFGNCTEDDDLDENETAFCLAKGTSPKNRRMSYAELIELSKSNILKINTKLRSVSESRTSTLKNINKYNNGNSSKGRKVLLNTSVGKELKIAPNSDPVARMSFDLKTSKMEIRLTALTYLERHYVRAKACFLIRNYKKVRRNANSIVSGQEVKKWRSLNAKTEFSESDFVTKKMRLHSFTRRLKNIHQTVPLALCYPIEELTTEERECVLNKHLFLLRNVDKVHHIIKSRVFITRSNRCPYNHNGVKIPQRLFGKDTGSLDDFYPAPVQIRLTKTTSVNVESVDS